ncbi:glycosyltransferase family 1 protein [Dyella solisilvae]|uniref:Glycosyltransferase family 1 protein n=1 Tax=Dyella solisilvae TaxID=1920168 RepID=A0A370K5T6_9GAMM|nr:glycosyltransferase family 4 protein [Dyella solisilvae]RDI98009.1 glycosyltransferase family 1 protein [Dyella solisilvae]
MKLALVVPGGVDRSGEYRVIPVLLALIERLAREHEVHVFALHQEASPGEWRLAGAHIHNLGERWPRVSAIAAIRREHRRGSFDLIHAIFSGSCSFVAVAAASLLRLPSLVHIAGGELVALRDIDYGGRRTWKARMREALVLHGADIITAASGPMIDMLRSLGLHAHRVPLGVDLRAWPPLAPRRRDGGTPRIIHVASLNRVKDQPTLLRALAELARTGQRFQVDIVGVDTLDGEIARMVRDLGLEASVHLLGFKTQRELRPLMEAADLLVMSSRHEAGPLVTLEAAVAGVPTVGTAVGHIAEWAPVAALAVPVGDSMALAVAIAHVLADEDLRLRLALSAQRRAIQEDADHTARSFETLYLQLVATDLSR